MADLVLDWGLLGSYGTDLAGPVTVDTGGVQVGIEFTPQDEDAQAFTFNADGYVGEGEPFDPNSFLKLFGEGGDGGGRSATSTTVLNFSSSDDAFTDQVQNVHFRLNDVDAGDGADLGDLVAAGSDGPSGGWMDHVSIRAYDAEGNEVPVEMTGSTATGGTATGDGTTAFTDADGSVLVHIDGPVARVEIVYENGGTEEQGVTVSDVHFATIDSGDENNDPIANDDTATTTVGTPVVMNVLENDSDPDGDPLIITNATSTMGVVTINDDGTLTYSPVDDFIGEDTVSYTIDDGRGGTDTADVIVSVGDDTGTGPDGYVDGTDEGDFIYTNSPDDRYDGDPNGDFVDSDDALLPGEVGDDDIIRAFGGDDTVVAGEGDDEVLAGEGDDSVTGGAGDDSLIGEEGMDTLIGGDGGDTIRGGADDDYIDASGSGPRIDTDVFPVADAQQALDPFDGLDEDPDPADDLDYAVGGAGDDTILTGDDDDTIEGGDGDDLIQAGIDDDLVFGGAGDDTIDDIQGADTVYGGAGNDSLMIGIDVYSDYVGDDPNLPFLGFTSDPNTEDNRDYAEGNTGDDYIMTGDDADTLDGGQGDDTLDAGIDDDLVMGGRGNDSILGGHGSDTIDGGGEDDYIDASNPASLEITDDIDTVPDNDRDSVMGATGNDTVITGDDDDTIDGGAGDDSLNAGIDEDLVHGGTGNDTIIGGGGADDLYGDADRDDFVIETAEDGYGDTISGDSTGDDWDRLILSGVGNFRLVDVVTDSDGNGIDGTVEYLSDDGLTVNGSTTFTNIEEVVPCFTPGTVIATPIGERLVEDLREGDRIITRDNGIQEIRWLGRKALTGHELARRPHLRPILIQAGSLGNGLPEHDMLVSPNHRILVNNDKTALYFEEREVLAAAKHLTGLEGVDEVGTLGVEYIHFMFDQHEVVLSNGSWTESFQPGDYTLDGIGNAQRNEILELFPELETKEGIEAYASARRSLKKHEAKLLVK